MNAQNIFFLQFISSFIVMGLLAKWKIAPWLRQLNKDDALFFLTIPHAFRYIGMSFLVPGLVVQTLPESFSIPAAYGDLIAGVIALLALTALQYRWAAAIAIVWVFNIVGTVDLLYAITHAGIAPMLGTTWYIPIFIVPLLLISHFLIFVRLIKQK